MNNLTNIKITEQNFTTYIHDLEFFDHKETEVVEVNFYDDRIDDNVELFYPYEGLCKSFDNLATPSGSDSPIPFFENKTAISHYVNSSLDMEDVISQIFGKFDQYETFKFFTQTYEGEKLSSANRMEQLVNSPVSATLKIEIPLVDYSEAKIVQISKAITDKIKEDHVYSKLLHRDSHLEEEKEICMQKYA